MIESEGKKKNRRQEQYQQAQNHRKLQRNTKQILELKVSTKGI